MSHPDFATAAPAPRPSSHQISVRLFYCVNCSHHITTGGPLMCEICQKNEIARIRYCNLCGTILPQHHTATAHESCIRRINMVVE